MRIDKALANRLFTISIDESPEQTRRIIKARGQRNRDAADYEPIKGLHTYLAGQDNRVVVPFEDVLTDLIDVSATRMRRDHERIMDLVEAHAVLVLHQESRQRDHNRHIVATQDDYAAVHDLIADIVGEASEVAVSDTVRETVETVRALIVDGEDVTRNTLAARLKIVPTSAGRRFGPASSAGYVKEDPDNPNTKPKRYVLGDVQLPENVEVMPSPERLRSCVSASDARGEDASNEQRASDDFRNALPEASVHARSSIPVSSTTEKPDTYKELSGSHEDENAVTGVPQNQTHGRTIFENEPDEVAESDIVCASVRNGCTTTNPPFDPTYGPIDGRVHVRAEDYERCDVCGYEDYEVRAQHHKGELWWRIVQICLNCGDAFTTLREDTHVRMLSKFHEPWDKADGQTRRSHPTMS